MKKTTNKDKQKGGLRLSELGVVVAVTVVLAAILMPAVLSTNPERAEAILKTSTFPVALTGTSKATLLVQPAKPVRRSAIRLAAHERTQARNGLKKMLTTDIRSLVP